MAISSMTPWTLSPVIELHWLGWRTDTYRMNQYGWDWVVEQNEFEQTFIIYARHERDNLKAVSDPIEVNFMQARCSRSRGYEKMGPFQMRMAHTIEGSNIVLRPVSMRPMVVSEFDVREQMMEFHSIDNFFVTEKWIRDQVDEERRKKITLNPETMKRRLDIPNGH
jgi:hypothetical protein